MAFDDDGLTVNERQQDDAGGQWSLDKLIAFTKQREVDLGTDEDGATTFYFEKMPAMKAHRVWRETLHALSATTVPDALGNIDIQSDDDGNFGLSDDGKEEAKKMLPNIVRGVLGIDVRAFLNIQNALFGSVKFSNANARTAQPLAGAENVAFRNLEVADIEQVTIRAFVVNFTPSLLKIASVVTGSDLTSRLRDH